MPTNLTEGLRLLLLEAYSRRSMIVGAFVAIALLSVLVGLTWPKRYTSYSTIYVEAQSVIGPLMQGAAVQSELVDRAMIAREVVYGRRLLNQIVLSTGFVEPDQTLEPSELDSIVEGIRDRTLVTNVGENMVRIEYADSDPQRSYQVAQQMADLFVSETLATKSRESQSAFGFIDQQVNEYQAKLQALDQRLKAFRNSNQDARTGADGESAHRISDLKGRIAQLEQDLREAEIRRASLQSQLSGEADAATVMSRAEQFRQRIIELQSQLDTLRLTYHETYPDVVRIKAQIAELEQAATNAEQQRAARTTTGGEEVMVATPLYQQLRGALYEANTTVSTINSRIDETRRQLREEEARAVRIQDAATDLAELTRDYEVNTQIYQDMLRRREAARVSMNLDRTQEGIAMRVEEPAFLPHNAEGPRLIYFIIGGIVLGVVLPLAALFGMQQADPRIRHPSVISDRLGLTALGVVPQLFTPREAMQEARSSASLALVVIATVVLIGGIGVMRMTGAI